MGGKGAIAAGLVTGAVAGAILVGAVVLLGPGPTVPVASPVPLPSEAVAASASVAPPSSPSAVPSPSSSVAVPSEGTSPGDAAFGVGRPAPPLAVPLLGGGQVSLAALKGKPVWVNFMATWCEPCRDEIPRMNAFAARYADQGLVVVAVDVRQDEAVVDAFARELSIAFPVGLDETGAAQQAWGAYAMPVHYWVDADGIVRYGALGGIGPDIMADGLETILPGVTVTP